MQLGRFHIAAAAAIVLLARLPADRPPCSDRLSRPNMGPFSQCTLLAAVRSVSCSASGMDTACACTCGVAAATDADDVTGGGGGLWWIRGEAYALGPWVAHHPGGARYLLNSVGTDITYLFESHHIDGTRARAELERFRVTPPPTNSTTSLLQAERYTVHFPATRLLPSARYSALKRDVARRFDLDHLKEPTLEYRLLRCGVLGLFVASLTLCLRRGSSLALGCASHVLLGVTITWLGAMAHNGMHLWPRRRLETLMFYLWFDNPFRWFYIHIQSHHMHTNTNFDLDLLPIDVLNLNWIWGRTGQCALTLLLGPPLQWLDIHLSQPPYSHGTAPSMSPLEQAAAPAVHSLLLGLGLAAHGPRRWLPLHLLTVVCTSTYAFMMFQTSHVQGAPLIPAATGAPPADEGSRPPLSPLAGDAIHNSTDDWGEFQLRTTLGWGSDDSARSATASMPFLFLNLQPAHHLFPALHHSQLHPLMPLIREHYPGLMPDHSLPQLLAGAVGTIASNRTLPGRTRILRRFLALLAGKVLPLS